MRVAFVGSRDYPRLDLVRNAVRGLPEGSTVVSGGARGVDSVAAEAAEVYGHSTMIFPAAWRTKNGKFDKGAGYKRNKDIVRAADKIVAFYDGQSKGTAHTIKLALAAKKPLVIIGPDGEAKAIADYGL